MSLELSTAIGDPNAGSIDRALAAGAAAFEQQGGLQGPPEGEPQAPPESTGEQPEPQAQPEEQAPPETPQEPADELYEVDYQGEVLRLSKADKDDLIRHGLEALVERRRGAQQPQGQPQAQPQARQLAAMPELPPELAQAMGPYMQGFQKYFNDRLTAVAEVMAEQMQQKQMQEITSEADRAMDEHEVFKAADPEARRLLHAMVLQYRKINEGSSFKTAAAKVAQVLKGRDQKAKNDFVKAKLKAASHPIEGKGGAPPTAKPQKFTGKDIFNGKLEDAATARFTELLKRAEQA